MSNQLAPFSQQLFDQAGLLAPVRSPTALRDALFSKDFRLQVQEASASNSEAKLAHFFLHFHGEVDYSAVKKLEAVRNRASDLFPDNGTVLEKVREYAQLRNLPVDTPMDGVKRAASIEKLDIFFNERIEALDQALDGLKRPFLKLTKPFRSQNGITISGVCNPTDISQVIKSIEGFQKLFANVRVAGELCHGVLASLQTLEQDVEAFESRIIQTMALHALCERIQILEGKVTAAGASIERGDSARHNAFLETHEGKAIRWALLLLKFARSSENQIAKNRFQSIDKEFLGDTERPGIDMSERISAIRKVLDTRYQLPSLNPVSPPTSPETSKQGPLPPQPAVDMGAAELLELFIDDSETRLSLARKTNEKVVDTRATALERTLGDLNNVRLLLLREPSLLTFDLEETQFIRYLTALDRVWGRSARYRSEGVIPFPDGFEGGQQLETTKARIEALEMVDRFLTAREPTKKTVSPEETFETARKEITQELIAQFGEKRGRLAVLVAHCGFFRKGSFMTGSNSIAHVHARLRGHILKGNPPSLNEVEGALRILSSEDRAAILIRVNTKDPGYAFNHSTDLMTPLFQRLTHFVKTHSPVGVKYDIEG